MAWLFVGMQALTTAKHLYAVQRFSDSSNLASGRLWELVLTVCQTKLDPSYTGEEMRIVLELADGLVTSMFLLLSTVFAVALPIVSRRRTRLLEHVADLERQQPHGELPAN